MQVFLYGSRGWHGQKHAIKPQQRLAERLKAIWYRPRRDRLRVAQLLSNGTHHGYNQALRLNRRLGASPRTFGMAYLEHAKPLSRDQFPTYWRKAVFQAYLPEQAPESASLLICFTGFAKALNMPLPCFHSIARKAFDGIAYFFDEKNDLYTTDQARLEQAIAGLLKMAPWQRVALIGTSGGGTVTLRFPKHPLIKRRLSASPPVCRDLQLLKFLDQEDFQNFHQSRIFFAHGNEVDTRHYDHLRNKLPADLFERCVFNLAWASSSHGTLATVMQLGDLANQLQWLSQDDESPQKQLSPIYTA